MSKHKTHTLVDRTDPNLLEDTFPYSLPPLIHFDGPMVEYIDGSPVKFDPAEVKARDIFITDTTFRDGQQARPPYTADQMVRIYDLLAKLGGPHGIIRQTEFFLYTSNDRQHAGPLPRPGTPLSRDHRLDPRQQGRLPPRPRSRAERDRHSHQLLRLPHLQEAEAQEPQGVHGRATAAWSKRRSTPASGPAATSKTSPAPTSKASSCRSASG